MATGARQQVDPDEQAQRALSALVAARIGYSMKNEVFRGLPQSV
jgi:hypothetical protein